MGWRRTWLLAILGRTLGLQGISKSFRDFLLTSLRRRQGCLVLHAGGFARLGTVRGHLTEGGKIELGG